MCVYPHILKLRQKVPFALLQPSSVAISPHLVLRTAGWLAVVDPAKRKRTTASCNNDWRRSGQGSKLLQSGTVQGTCRSCESGAEKKVQRPRLLRPNGKQRPSNRRTRRARRHRIRGTARRLPPKRAPIDAWTVTEDLRAEPFVPTGFFCRGLSRDRNVYFT